jgi:hypothetical protein
VPDTLRAAARGKVLAPPCSQFGDLGLAQGRDVVRDELRAAGEAGVRHLFVLGWLGTRVIKDPAEPALP